MMAFVFVRMTQCFKASKNGKLDFSVALQSLFFSQCLVLVHYYAIVQFFFTLITCNRCRIELHNIQIDLLVAIIKIALITTASILYYSSPDITDNWMDQNNNGFYYILCLGFLIIFKIFLSILSIRFIKSLGFILLSLKFMFKDIIKFLFIYLLQLLGFSLMLSIIFFKSPVFDIYYISFVILFYNSINMPFPLNENTYNLHNLGPDVSQAGILIGHLIVGVFFVCNIIIISNLIIAILTDAYELAKDDKKVLFIQEVLKILPKYEKSSEFYSIFCAPIPINVLLFPLMLILILLPRRSQRFYLNRIILHIEYIFVAALIILGFLITQILLLPIIYVIEGLYLFQNFSSPIPFEEDNIVESKPSIRRFKHVTKLILKYILWLAIGLFILIYYIGKDVIQLITSLYISKRAIYNPMNPNHSTFEEILDQKLISFKAYKKALEIFEQCREDKIEYLTEIEFKRHLLYKNEINEVESRDLQEIKNKGIYSLVSTTNTTIWHDLPASVKLEKIFKNGFYRDKSRKNQKVLKVSTICEIMKNEKAMHISKHRDKGEFHFIKTNTRNILNTSIIYDNLVQDKKKGKLTIKQFHTKLSKQINDGVKEIKEQNKEMKQEIVNELKGFIQDMYHEKKLN